MRPSSLQSDRLALTSLLPSDAAAVFDYCSDPELQRYTRVPVPYTRADAEFFTTAYAIDASRDENLCVWAIRTRDANRSLVGAVELRLDAAAGAELGFWVGRPHRGTGVMTEALALVIEHAFSADGLNLELLRWDAAAGNQASARVARRCGFRFRGTLEKHLVIRDEAHDAWVAELRRDDPREPRDGWPL